MLQLRRHSRRVLLVWLAAGTIAFGIIALPGISAASNAPAVPYFVEWVPGTPLPTIPAGWSIEAWPSQQTLAALSVGQSVPVTAVDASGPTAAQQSQLQPDSAGIVNLEVDPPASSTGVPPDTACGWAFVRDLGSEPANVMQSYSTISGVLQTFTYGQGQSSSLGVGISSSGSYGSFSASGTTSVSTNSTQGFARQRNRSFNHFQTYFEISEYYNACDRLDMVRPYQWNAGTNYVHPSGAPGATHCTPMHHAGDWFEKSTTAATTFGVGFSTPVGFTGSAQTGYSGTASIKFNFNVIGQLCGVNNTPPNSPGVLVAS